MSATYGWKFFVEKPTGSTFQIYPVATGSLSHDSSRQIRRAVNSVTLLADDVAKLQFPSDQIQIFLSVRRQKVLSGDPLYDDHIIGVFNFSNNLRRPDAYRDPKTREAVDIYTVDLSDNLIRLNRNTGASETLYTGADPTFEMNRILDDAGLLHSIAGSASDTQDDVTWDGSTRDLDKIYQLAEIAGHRPPWADNHGVIRSVAAAVVEEDVIELSNYDLVADTVAITENYLTAPNRIIVVDNGPNQYAIRGQWDAPSSAPHSFANLGYHRTEIVTLQGLSGTDHAITIAEALGEQMAARGLGFDLAVPTTDFDGPVILRYDDSLWLVDSWTISLDPNGRMSVTATEIFQ